MAMGETSSDCGVLGADASKIRVWRSVGILFVVFSVCSKKIPYFYRFSLDFQVLPCTFDLPHRPTHTPIYNKAAAQVRPCVPIRMYRPYDTRVRAEVPSSRECLRPGRTMMQTAQQELTVERIRQYPGPVQVLRKVTVQVPGKHFPSLQQAEQAQMYDAQAVEYAERHKFSQHTKAWGAAQTSPGIRFICTSDALDDPNHQGFWTTLALWNRWRHTTYKDNRAAELQFLDELPHSVPPPASEAKKAAPEVKTHYIFLSEGIHTYGGTGRLAGKTEKCSFWLCKKAGCKKGNPNDPVKQIGTGTGQLFSHLNTCQPELAEQLRVRSKHSPTNVDEDGNIYTIFSFDELLPHHARYVQKCFRRCPLHTALFPHRPLHTALSTPPSSHSFDHFYETRADNGLLEWVQGYEKRAGLPHEQTCSQLLAVHDELVEENIMLLIDAHIKLLGNPCAGAATDAWSLKSCRASFFCYRGSFIMEGDMIIRVLKIEDEALKTELQGTLVDFSPILAFDKFKETSHSGAAIARWKTSVTSRWHMQGSVGLATEDGAAPNKKSNAILKIEQKVCTPHDVARAVLHAAGETGTPCKNPEMKKLTARTTKQSAAFNRSVVANEALQQAQLDEDQDLKPHQTLSTTTKNTTRWLGLWSMANRDRRLQPDICMALTGSQTGLCAEAPARKIRVEMLLEDSDSDNGVDSDGDDQEEGNITAGKNFPLAHRCLSSDDFASLRIMESVLDRAREVTLLVQAEDGGGMDLGIGFLVLRNMRAEYTADRIELVSGRKTSETWTEVSALSLPEMFKTFRSEFASQIATRFSIDTTPDRHTLLALKMHPAINTEPDCELLEGKTAMAELMEGEYVRALRRQAMRQPSGEALPPPAATAAAAAATDMHGTPLLSPDTSVPDDPGCGPKRRKGLMGAVVSAQMVVREEKEDESEVDKMVGKEMVDFQMIKEIVLEKASLPRISPSHSAPSSAPSLAPTLLSPHPYFRMTQGVKSEYYDKSQKFNLYRFWVDHKKLLPLHYLVYLAEVGCKKMAASCVESVFSGAGKFTEEAKSAGPILLQRVVKLHYNWKYKFLRPPMKKIITHYNKKHGHKCPLVAPMPDSPAPSAVSVPSPVTPASGTSGTPGTSTAPQ